jgi:F0F1-type ATP synthase assembly protein I
VSSPLPARPALRYPLHRIAGWQLIATLAIAGLGGLWAGWPGAISALLGGFVNVTAGAAYTLLIGIGSVATAAATLRTALRAEAAKIAMIVLQLWLVLATYREVVHPAFFSAFVVTVLVSQAAILVRD